MDNSNKRARPDSTTQESTTQDTMDDDNDEGSDELLNVLHDSIPPIARLGEPHPVEICSAMVIKELCSEFSEKFKAAENLKSALKKTANNEFPRDIPQKFSPYLQFPKGVNQSDLQAYKTDQQAIWETMRSTLYSARVEFVKKQLNDLTIQLTNDFVDEKFKSRVRDKLNAPLALNKYTTDLLIIQVTQYKLALSNLKHALKQEYEASQIRAAPQPAAPQPDSSSSSSSSISPAEAAKLRAQMQQMQNQLNHLNSRSPHGSGQQQNGNNPQQQQQANRPRQQQQANQQHWTNNQQQQQQQQANRPQQQQQANQQQWTNHHRRRSNPRQRDRSGSRGRSQTPRGTTR